MEFLRFGSSIPGGYWGCCAVDIIQDFSQDPDEKASIQVVSGDGGGAIVKNGKCLYLGPTYRDIFHQRLRIGTFSTQEMPNHVFMCVLTQSQIDYGAGKKWLPILKEAGFEFIRATDNSVYTGHDIDEEHPPHPNYIFGLFRNIGKSAIPDPHLPPKAWTDLPEQEKTQTELWHEGSRPEFLTEEDLVRLDVPIIQAGLRSKFPPELKSIREGKKEKEKAGRTTSITNDPFGADKAECEPEEEEFEEEFFDEDE